MAEAFGELDPNEGASFIETLTPKVDALSPPAYALHSYLIENSEATYVVENLAALHPTMTRLRDCLALVISDYAALSREQLIAELKPLGADLAWLPDLLPILADVLELPPELQGALR